MSTNRSDTAGRPRRSARMFRQRQISVRSDGEVRVYTIRPWMQVSALAVAMGGMLAIGYTSVTVAEKERIIQQKEQSADVLREKYEGRLSTLWQSLRKVYGHAAAEEQSHRSTLAELQELQHELEARHEMLEAVLDRISGTPPKPRVRPERASSARQRGQTGANPASNSGDAAPGSVERSKAQFRRRIERLKRDQAALLDRIEQNRRSEAKEIRRRLSQLGIKPAVRAPTAKPVAAAMGGPFVGVGSLRQDRALEHKVRRIERSLAEIALLRDTVQAMPVARPLGNGYRLTSGFGERNDPFRKVKALHAGIDFAGPKGTPISATAPGTVVRAGRLGGYGMMVEIRHANGITTRFAHLSAIKVKTGAKVRRGETVGLLGSTGRSTGPHLHYEVRVAGKPVDPAPFLHAGEDLLNRGY